jgi:hypothetical protein
LPSRFAKSDWRKTASHELSGGHLIGRRQGWGFVDANERKVGIGIVADQSDSSSPMSVMRNENGRRSNGSDHHQFALE